MPKPTTKTSCSSVDEYIASKPDPVQTVLKSIRTAIAAALPGAEEVISYNIPTYKLHGRAMLYFAGWKNHYSIYPATAGLVAAFQDDLQPYTIEKGTIRFPLSQPVPLDLIRRIAEFRAAEATAAALAPR